MNFEDICKFSTIRSSDLVCTNLVYEVTEVQSTLTYTEEYKFGYVLKGSGTLNQNRKSCTLNEGDAFIVFKNSNFSITQNGDLKYFYVSFYGRRADELIDRFQLSDAHCVFNMKENYEQISTFAFDCLKKANSHNADLFGETVLLYLFAHLEVKSAKQNDLMSAIISITNKEFTSVEFSLKELARLTNYDAKYISFLFKKNKGICYSQYLRDLRIKRSIFLMEQGITSIKNIAILSGFKDALYFSKIFKQETKQSHKYYILNLQRNT
ncbi:MAG: helix-turn-helix transcriptional regulator [Clostridia bacterium]|nr:helix-turn-helix transcriptional regulator [Clostridia bacterium]